MRRKIRKIILIIISVLLLAVTFFELTVKERLELVVISEIKKTSLTALNSAVSDYISKNDTLCKALLDIESESSGVKYLTENTANVNLMKSQLNVHIAEYIENSLIDKGIDVKFGNFIGLVIFSEVGPYIHFNIESVPTVDCSLNSTFESSGINQTIHHIQLVVNVDIFIGNPFKIESIKLCSDFDISQSVIIGSTPSTYGSFSGGTVYR